MCVCVCSCMLYQRKRAEGCLFHSGEPVLPSVVPVSPVTVPPIDHAPWLLADTFSRIVSAHDLDCEAFLALLRLDMQATIPIGQNGFLLQS